MKSITKDGINSLAASSNQASRRLKIKMMCKNPSLAAAAAAAESSSSSSSSSSSTPTPTPTSTYRLKNNVEVVEPLLQASKNIILLKEKEYDPILLNYVNIDDIELLRDIICLNKLPNFKKTEEISEMELTTNYLDPVLSPIFHNPEKNKHLLWLNRKEENTNSFRPDAVMKHYDMKLSGTTLGYCEVEPADAQHDIDGLCTDLIRLASFSRNIMSRKDNKIACSLQAVGSHCSFYVVSSISNDISIMNEVISFQVPMQIKELSNLNTITDELKQISKIYDNHCHKRYVSDIEDNYSNIASLLKPKRRKRVADATPITFN
ncbi:hypothetical protein G6F37_007290 [Rhizopus arrhizus]|nr:hypothetical protein G6F38_007409 [Rhizopus arrhizus]KAG1156784.1 hypothetical protein G6F37_007290 [Rhizopus arrhizus]